MTSQEANVLMTCQKRAVREFTIGSCAGGGIAMLGNSFYSHCESNLFPSCIFTCPSPYCYVVYYPILNTKENSFVSQVSVELLHACMLLYFSSIFSS